MISRRPLLLILMIWAAGLGAAAQFGKVSIAYQDLSAIYADQVGFGLALMVSIVGMVGLIFGTTAGLMVARLGPRRVIIWALFLGGVVSFLQSALPPYPVMMLTRAVEGVSHLAIVVVGPTAIASAAAARWQGAAMTLWSSFFGLTFAALAWLGPGIVVTYGLPGLFQLHGTWMLVCAAILRVLMPTDPAPQERRSGTGILQQHLDIYCSPTIAAPAMGFVCYTVTYVAVLTLLPGAMDPKWSSAAAVAMPLVSITVSLTLGVWLLSRMSAVNLVQTGFAAALVASAALWAGWGNGAAQFAAAIGLAASLGIVQGASFAAIAQLNPTTQARAHAAGAVAQLGNLGTTIGTPVLAVLLNSAGVLGLTLFLAGFSGLGIVIHQHQARRRTTG